MRAAGARFELEPRSTSSRDDELLPRLPRADPGGRDRGRGDQRARDWTRPALEAPARYGSPMIEDGGAADRRAGRAAEYLDGDRLSLGVAARLSRYLQVLTQARKMGKDTISSQELSDYTHINSTQIRRDLSGFGKFGKRGVGYNVDSLVREIRKILRTAGQHNIALFGAGNLGQAIASSDIFADHGFRIVAMFDVDPAVVGRRRRRPRGSPLRRPRAGGRRRGRRRRRARRSRRAAPRRSPTGSSPPASRSSSTTPSSCSRSRPR